VGMWSSVHIVSSDVLLFRKSAMQHGCKTKPLHTVGAKEAFLSIKADVVDVTGLEC